MCIKEYQDIKIFVKGEKFRTTYYPHFEVNYRGMLKAKFSFDLSILEGRLPADVTIYVINWAQRNCNLLKSEWDSILNKKHIQ